MAVSFISETRTRRRRFRDRFPRTTSPAIHIDEHLNVLGGRQPALAVLMWTKTIMGKSWSHAGRVSRLAGEERAGRRRERRSGRIAQYAGGWPSARLAERYAAIARRLAASSAGRSSEHLPIMATGRSRNRIAHARATRSVICVESPMIRRATFSPHSATR